jgi:ribosomal protein L16/L10AE
MGKGKGKRQTWCINIPSGFVFLEFKNLRVGRNMYFLKQLMFKLPVSSYVTTKFYNNLNFKKGLSTIHPFY